MDNPAAVACEGEFNIPWIKGYDRVRSSRHGNLIRLRLFYRKRDRGDLDEFVESSRDFSREMDR